MALVQDRIQAAFTDTVLALIPNFLLTFITNDISWHLILLGATFPFYSLLSVRFWGHTFGQNHFSLYLTGNGCLPCRELQRSWPAILWFIAGCLSIIGVELFTTDTPSWVYTIRNALLLGGLIGIAINTFLLAFPSQRYWDRNTGFHLRPIPSS